MKHLRTRRKPNKKNIGNIVFAIIFVFVCMSILITISDLTKRPKTDISYAKSDFNLSKEDDSLKSGDNGQTGAWTLNNSSLLMTKNGDEIFIELANTELEREIGLSGRDKLSVYSNNQQVITEGMLFDFEKVTTMNFWMKDMNFDLDMIWLDNNFKIVHIEKNAKADSYNASNPSDSKLFSNSKSLARYVLEINAGLADEMDLKVGDSLSKKY